MPDLTLVVTSRNDDHGGNLLNRAQIFVNTFMSQVEKYHINAELVFVEWNPVPNKRRLYQLLKWPHSSCEVRVIEVPHRIHRKFKHSDSLPLFQMIAKNVGICRARGKFVLSTNVDVVFSEKLAAFLGSGILDADLIYRIDRYDVGNKVPLRASLQTQLAYCRKNVIRVNTKAGTFKADWFFWHGLGPLKQDLINLHMLLRRIRWNRKHLRSRTLKMLRSLDALSYSILRRIGVIHPYPQLHTNGCGDFTLLSRESWWALRGYPELEIFSFHLDSLFLHMAHHLGLRVKILNGEMRLYHIEHLQGWTPKAEREMYRRLQRQGIPILSYAEFESMATQMNKTRRPLILNDENWGLRSEKLREFVVN
jgi:glycosyltransferase involved in cell wall biosynthesis